MLAMTLVWPKFFYPLVWISLAFIFEPGTAGWAGRIFWPGCNTATGGR